MEKTSDKGLAVVTGASSGIGLELARQFAENGFDLLIASNSERIQQAAESLRRGGRCGRAAAAGEPGQL